MIWCKNNIKNNIKNPIYEKTLTRQIPSDDFITSPSTTVCLGVIVVPMISNKVY